MVACFKEYLLLFLCCVFVLPPNACVASEDTGPLLVIEAQDSNPSVISEDSAAIELQIPLEKHSTLAASIKKMGDTIPPRLDSLMKKLKVPQDVREYSLSDLQRKLQTAPTVINNSNASAIGGCAYSCVALGLNPILLQSFKFTRSPSIHKNRIARFLLNRGGTGLLLGVGFLIFKVKHEGKNKIVLRLYGNREVPTRVMSYMTEVFGGGAVSKVSAIVNMNELKFFEKVQTTLTNYGTLGRLTVTDDYFEYAFASGFNLAAPVSSASIYDLHQVQYRLNLFIPSGWYEKMKSRYQIAIQRSGRSCRKLFGSDK